MPTSALQIASLTPRDVAIDVPMGDIGTSDFTRIPEAVELGRRAADGMREQLSRYSVPEAEYLAWVDVAEPHAGSGNRSSPRSESSAPSA